MAKRTVVQVIMTDDLDAHEAGTETEAHSTVLVALVAGGVAQQAELELSAKHEAELGELLARYFAAGRRPASPLSLPKQPRVPATAPGRVAGPATRRLLAYCRHVAHDPYHRADGEPYSGGKPYFGPTLQRRFDAFVETDEGRAWLAGLSEADGGEGS